MGRALPVRRTLLIALLFVVCIVLLLSQAARLLVVNRPEAADAIVVLAGGTDERYLKGLELLNQGYGRALLVDARTDTMHYGRTPAFLEQQFIDRTAGGQAGRVELCPVQGDSTRDESTHVAACLLPTHARRVLLVTSDYHTRRSFSIFRSRLPQYHWSVCAARNGYVFGVNWWRHREWAKTTLLEWTKLVWWEVVDRWR